MIAASESSHLGTCQAEGFRRPAGTSPSRGVRVPADAQPGAVEQLQSVARGEAEQPEVRVPAGARKRRSTSASQ